jgi:hypothetical protein
MATETTASTSPPANGAGELLPPVSELRADTVLALMKEYEQKLRTLVHRFREIQGDRKSVNPTKSREEADRALRLQIEYEEVGATVRRLVHPMEDLARHASALSEHGRVDRVTRLELRLRSAEIETAIERARLEVR